MKLNVFCANCQTETSQAVTSSKSEIVATCDCGRFLKWPAMPIEQFKELLAQHAADNKGQVKITPEEEKAASAGADFLASLAEAGVVEKE